MATKEETKLIVAGIDIGTKFSGYAYSFRSDYFRDPLLITTNEWLAEGATSSSHKAPTTILLDSNSKFHSFGFKAEDKYADLSEREEHQEWYYFQRFKMQLMSDPIKELDRDMEISDINDKRQPAMKIFSLTIEYLKNHLVRSLEHKGLGFTNEDIHWVVTVPSIWDDAAKQFMREASVLAGIKDYQLSLAYEPESAALYCKQLPPDKFGGTRSVNLFIPGQQIMVLDLGGGTADVTVIEITEKRNLRHIFRASGGAWGGTKVDDDYFQFLVKIFGGNVLVRFRETDMHEYLQMFRQFEIKKKKITNEDTDDMIVIIPAKLKKLLKEETGCKIDELLAQSNFHGLVTLATGNKLKINHNIYKTFFHKSLEDIQRHVQDVLSNPKCSKVSAILMVGGYSESKMAVDMIRRTFPGIQNIIVPPEASISIMCGSVLYGHDPQQIKARVCQFSYGIAVYKQFEEGKHPEKKSFFMDGKKRVDDCFEKLFHINEIVEIGEKRQLPVQNTHIDDDRQQWRREHKEIEIFASTSAETAFITDRGCFKLGTVLVSPPIGGWPERMKGRIDMEIGGTEITVSYVDEYSDLEISGKINCLHISDSKMTHQGLETSV